MASAKEIQDRMRSIKDTLKITNAMYMISSSKLKKSKKMLADTEPYFYTLQSEMSRILRHLPDMNSIYFKTNAEIPERKRKAGYIVITADKGLAGSYNHNILKLAEEELEKRDCNMKTQMMIAVMAEEIFINIAHYAYTDKTGQVKICLDFKGDDFYLTFIDSGIEFDPL